jgi:hypothetical protein
MTSRSGACAISIIWKKTQVRNRPGSMHIGGLTNSRITLPYPYYATQQSSTEPWFDQRILATMITAISENCDRPAYLLHSECFMGLGPCECEQACEDARPRRGMGFKKKTQISILQTNFSRMLAARRVTLWLVTGIFGDGMHSAKLQSSPLLWTSGLTVYKHR